MIINFLIIIQGYTMKKMDGKNSNLKYEEMEEVQEFSFGSIGITTVSIMAILIIISQFLF